MAQPLTLAKLRARMDRDPKTMEKLVRQVNKAEELHLSGKEFKRRKEAPSKLLDPWYNKRGGFSVGWEGPHDDLLWSPALKDHILEEWEKLVPLFRYLSTVDGDRDPTEEV